LPFLAKRKKNIKSDTVKDTLRSMFVNSNRGGASSSMLSPYYAQSMLSPYYISKSWLHKLKYLGEAGPVDNSDFLCVHNFIQPSAWRVVDSLVVATCEDTWKYLIETFGLKWTTNTAGGYKNVCNYLYPCRECQREEEQLKQRQFTEKSEFIRLREKMNLEQLNRQISNNSRTVLSNNCSSNPTYAISCVWFRQWEQFVQFPGCPLKHQIPGAINNQAICLHPAAGKEKTNQLNPSNA
jgi:ubiquitin carboxyl-terminal hydrolase 20/33